MTQIIDDYLSSLAASLTFLPQPRQHETIAFYREFLLDGDFQTEKEIIKELGQPDSLADSIKDDYEEADIARTFSDTPSQTSGNYILNFHVKKNPLHKRTIHPSEFSKVKFEMNNADVVVQSGEQFEVKIVDFASRPIEVKSTDHTLLVKELPAKQKNYGIMINWDSNVSYVQITVPNKNALSRISGRSKNGNIVLQSLHLQNITFELENGDLIINNLDVKEEAIIASQNGDLQISQSRIADISVRLHNGNADLKRSVLNLLMLQTRDGDCVIVQCNVHLNIEAKDGDVEIMRSQLINENQIKESNGDINIRQLVHEVGIKLNTEDGDIIYRNSSIGNSFSSKSTQNDTLYAWSKDGDIILH